MPKTRIVSWSEIDTARQCPHKHNLGYKQRWTSPTTSPALSRGTAWHTMMEAHYNLLRDQPDLPIRSVQTEVLFETLAPMQLDDEQTDLLEWMYRGYCERWGSDTGWKVRAVEHAAEVWLPTDRGGRSNFKLKLKPDLLVQDGSGLWLIDHKTGRNLPKKKDLDLEDQFSLYAWAMRQLGHKVRGSIHNAVRTQKNKDQVKHPQPLDERFQRTRIAHTDLELHNIAVEAYLTVRSIYGYEVEGVAPPRHPNSDTCSWKCDFTEACLMARRSNRPSYQSEVLFDMGFRQVFERH